MKNVFGAVILLFAGMIFSCSRDRSKDVNDAMNNFTIQMAGQNADSIAALYTTDGVIAGEGQRSVIGKDSIRKMFKSFAGFTVLKYTTVPSITQMTGDSARQDGSYKQIVVIPSGDTLRLTGKYNAVLILENDDWRIRRIYTFDYGKF